MLTLLLLVILTALVFEFINGFHDTANSIATVVATKVLTPMQAVALAATTNLIGAFYGTAVAKTISSGVHTACSSATSISPLPTPAFSAASAAERDRDRSRVPG